MTRVLLYANDDVGELVAGPGVRYEAFARELRRSHEVILAAPRVVDSTDGAVEVVRGDHAGLLKLARSADVVVAQRLPLAVATRLARTKTRIVYDLYAPTIIENVVALSSSRVRATNAAALRFALSSGDAFICASERQRDFWLGALAVAGRIDVEAYSRDPGLRSLIDVVGFGIDREPPAPAVRALRGVVAGIDRGDLVLLWPGGLWDWLDPETVIRAVARVAGPQPVRLYFLGLAPPRPEHGAQRAVARAEHLAAELGVVDRHVFFNRGWVSFAERAAYLVDADVGVTAHHAGLEAHLAYRSRLLDCIWSRLPIVTSKGDVLAELVEREGIGVTVEPGDVEGWVDAIGCLSDPDRRASARAETERIAPELEWHSVVEPLEAMIASTEQRGGRLGRRSAALASYVAHRAASRFEPKRG